MPIYEFECTACSHRFEELVPTCSDTPLPCPACASTDTRKLMSAGAVGRSARGLPSCSSSCPGAAGCGGGGGCSQFS